MFVFGAYAFVWATVSRPVRQRAVPTAAGRVNSVYMVGVYAGLVVGSALGGLIARQLGGHRALLVRSGAPRRSSWA